MAAAWFGTHGASKAVESVFGAEDFIKANWSNTMNKELFNRFLASTALDVVKLIGENNTTVRCVQSNGGYISVQELEKFTELIVKECLAILDDEDDGGYEGRSVRIAGMRIKTLFGVT